MIYSFSQSDSGIISDVAAVSPRDLRAHMVGLANHVLYPKPVYTEIQAAHGWPFKYILAGQGWGFTTEQEGATLIALLREHLAGELDAFLPHPADAKCYSQGEKIQLA